MGQMRYMASSMVIISVIILVLVAPTPNRAARTIPTTSAHLDIHNNDTNGNNDSTSKQGATAPSKEVGKGDDGHGGVGIDDRKNLFPISGGAGAGMGGYGEMGGGLIPGLGVVGPGMRSEFGMGGGLSYGGGAGAGAGSGTGISSGGLSGGLGAGGPGVGIGGAGGLSGSSTGGFGVGSANGFGGGSTGGIRGLPFPFP
ncbi:glycine-rich protein 23-like [Punica granatum]|uniref:Uncharacterized protein n=2 Tax=Punica granatum TaxID=22663 RepID=A0A218XP72_PUNGR|nr:glycine-rich protein 23-like [Punica granatum]OWM86469.1 hypothetical protein CDL15_Pgr026361 [Punica granatum]PKI51881.1 hypothetical protein CRG98_027714 [Punica granatum]